MTSVEDKSVDVVVTNVKMEDIKVKNVEDNSVDVDNSVKNVSNNTTIINVENKIFIKNVNLSIEDQNYLMGEVDRSVSRILGNDGISQNNMMNIVFNLIHIVEKINRPGMEKKRIIMYFIGRIINNSKYLNDTEKLALNMFKDNIISNMINAYVSDVKDVFGSVNNIISTINSETQKMGANGCCVVS